MLAFSQILHLICRAVQLIENQYVLSENRNAKILIDLVEYDAKYITKKTFYIFTIIFVIKKNIYK